MTPGRKQTRPLRAGMTGVRIPGHVGKWDVVMEMDVEDPKGNAVKLCAVRSASLGETVRMLVTGASRVIYVKIPGDWFTRLEQKGWKL